MTWQEKVQKTLAPESFKGTAGVVIKDVQGKVKMSVNGGEVFPSASLIKLPVLWTLFMAAHSGKLSLDDTLMLKNKDKVDGGILHKYREGALLRLEDLALLMISVSDNTAANLVIDRLGKDRINNEIKDLGLHKTILGRKMLDFEAKKEGKDNYTTPEDMASLLEIMLTSPKLPASLRERMLELMTLQKLNSKLPSLIPFNDVDDIEGFLAHKTGELPGSEHDAGIFFHGTETPVIVTILTKDLSSRMMGVELCSKIGLIIFEHFGKGNGTFSYVQ